MKTLIILLLSFQTIGQVTEVDRQPILTTPVLSVTLYGSDSTYVLAYRNQEYKYIDDFKSMVFDSEQYQEFKQACIRTLEEGVELTNGKWSLNKMGKSVRVFTLDGFFYLRTKDVNNL